MPEIGEELKIVVPRDGRAYRPGDAVNLVHEPAADEPWYIEPHPQGEYELVWGVPMAGMYRVFLRKIR